MILSRKNRIITSNNRILSTIDPDALKFIVVAGITNPTHITALDYLCTNLKNANIWVKFNALYPFIGGTASTHKWNLKDPRDLDVAFRLQFFGGITHSATGALPNGISGYANTFLKYTNIINPFCLSYYSRTNDIINNSYEISVYATNITGYSVLSINSTSDITFITETGYYTQIKGNTNTTGFFAGTISDNIPKLFVNGVYRNQSKGAIGQKATTTSFYLFCAKSDGGIRTGFSNRECAFASIGAGLSDIDAINFYNIVQKYQTILGRQV